MSKCEQCIVRQLSSLKALSREELIEMSQTKTAISVKKGETLFEEGEHLSGVYCIKEGFSKLTKLSSNGKQQIVRFVKKGDLLGQRSVISDEAVNLNAVAVSDMHVCFIPKNEVVKNFKKSPNFAVEVVKDVCTELKTSDNVIVDMAQKTVKQRLAATLLSMHETFEIDTDGFINVQLTREEVASIVGTATESLIRMLSDFSKNGLLTVKGKKIKIDNLRELENISEGM